MKTSWLKEASTEKEKEEVRAIFLAAAPAFEILTGILERKIKARDDERNRPENYKLPSFGAYQADVSGYIRALREVQSTIES